MTLAFTSIKSEETRLSDNKLFQAFSINSVYVAVAAMASKFGDTGLNPALSAFYIMLEVSQYDTPNTYYEAYQLNHYLWAYFVGSLAGGALGGLLHLVHAKCTKTDGDENSAKEVLID